MRVKASRNEKSVPLDDFCLMLELVMRGLNYLRLANARNYLILSMLDILIENV